MGYRLDLTSVTTTLPTGAELRLSGGSTSHSVLFLPGTSMGERPGKWSATCEWLAEAVRDELPERMVAQLRFRVASWKRLDLLTADALAAIALLRERGATEVSIVGHSGGGTAGLAVAGTEGVVQLIGLAPWFPPAADPPRLIGRRVAVFHGTFDGIPFLPGTRPSASRASLSRLAALGADVAYTAIPGGLHSVVLRSPLGGFVRLPRSRRWRELLLAELASYAAAHERVES